jgi:hypothetical protein
MDIDFQDDDVVQFQEIDIAQSIGSQPLNKEKEPITNKEIKSRLYITLMTLLIVIVVLITISML